MILKAPRSIVHYFRCIAIAGLVSDRVAHAVPDLLTGFTLARRKRTQAELARSVFIGFRHKSTVSRIFRDPNFKSRDMFKAAMADAIARLLALVPRKSKTKIRWFLAIDATSTKRGAFTKIAGANQFKEKESGTKGRSTKAHCFLMGILITHEGVIIPLPRYTCYPKKSGSGLPGRPSKATQQDLAVQMLKDLLKLLPKCIQLVVCADEYFEGKKLTRLAKRRGVVFIAPVDTNRCFADDGKPDRSNGRNIHDRGRRLQLKTFSQVDLVRGVESTVSYRRYSERKAGPKDYRTYYVRHEARTVAGLGTVMVVYSWKCPIHERSKKNFDEMTFKVLVCSDPSWSGAEIVEWYEIRWQVEVFFRLIKQELGLGDYEGQDLRAFERHVDTVLLSFLYLEMKRVDILESPYTKEEVREKARYARTRGIQEFVRAEANQELWELIQKSRKSERSWRLLKAYFKEISTGGGTFACAA